MKTIRVTWRQRLSKSIYDFFIGLVTPILRIKLLRRGKKEAGYLADIEQRFGQYKTEANVKQPCIWLHAVSLGETKTAAIFIKQLRQQYQDLSIVLTNGTATGRQAGQELLQAGDVQLWQPWDRDTFVRKFLQRFQPKLAVILETEIWPNLIEQTQKQNIPIFLINARLSEKSLRSSNKWSSLISPTYQALTGVLAQSQADAKRITSMGGKVLGVFGNIKFDLSPNISLQTIGTGWQQLSSKPILMLASSRDGEEQMLLEALNVLTAEQLNQFVILIVPRHPQRFNEVEQICLQRGWAVQRRSVLKQQFPKFTDFAQKTVLLGDSIGEMACYYSFADIALLGGSFQPLGGQNLIEACAYSCPVIHGQSIFNFKQVAQLANQAGVAIATVNITDALQQAVDLLASPQQLLTLQSKANEFVQQHQGATANSLQILAPWLTSLTNQKITNE